VDHCSNSVDWRGSNFRICTPLLTRPRCRRGNCIHVHNLYVQSCRPPMKLPPPSAWSGRKLSGQSTNQTSWSASRRQRVDRCDWHVIETHVAMLFACVGDGAVAKSLGLRAETVAIVFITRQSTQPTQSWLCYGPNDRTGWYNKTIPNVNSNLEIITKVWISGKTNLETKLYYKTSEECHHTTEIHL